LNDSYRQAVLALHLRHHPEKDIVFFHETRKENTKVGGYAQLRRVLDDLEQALLSGSLPSLESWKERFLDLALNLSFQDPHEIRWHFRYALDRLAGAVTTRLGIDKQEGLQVREGLGRDMEGAANTQELVAAFQKELSRLVEMQSRPSTLGKVLSLERAKDHVDQHFTEPIRVTRLAKMTGVSASTFSRAFKKLTGTGLEGYLQALRLEAAKRLLKSGSLPVSRVAKDCGFGSSSYFTRLFRAKVGVTPKKFRQGARNK
jgi:AraC-like DNA-binding protein